ncbi:hypothetical protein JCGZ_26938 [Jatropha curcas]|uniref:FAS1 domain-containing protein n=2 Tax=Jatropha curcas TaxID=180498 RepID=A0A067LBQ1_JATCU|nr:hypothetical protein JCGZ_26938 [Jatropha curcas]
MLNQYSDYGTFNDLLSKTRIAEAINSRRTITVLAVDNGNLGALTGYSTDVQKHILDLHVVLDYYDETKLKNIKKKSALLTTLYQSTGSARGQQGFLNVTNDGGSIRFGSAVKGSGLNANLVGSVTSQPYNISVLQVSNIIIPQGLDTSNTPPPAKTPSPSEAPEPSAETPTPEAHSSVSSPPAGDSADGPSADGPAADSPQGGATAIGGAGNCIFAVIFMVLFSAWAS